MRKFGKFYEGLSDSVVPILIVSIVGIIGWILKAASGSGVTDSDMSVVLVAAAIGVGTVILWVVCTIIRIHQINKRVKSGGGRI